MDHAITDFLTCKPTGAIVQLGVGLETTYYHDRTLWYGIDLPHVIEHRKALLDNADREILVAGTPSSRVDSALRLPVRTTVDSSLAVRNANRPTVVPLLSRKSYINITFY